MMMETVKSYDEISGAYLDYQKQGLKTVKVSDTVSSLAIVGKDDIGKIAGTLTDVKFGNNITKIDEYCCANATSLTSVTPNNAKIIADHAFENCTKLSAFQPFIDGSPVYTVGNNAFANTKLQKVVLNLQNKDDATYDYQGCVKTDKDTGPYAGRYAFYNCKDLKSVEFRRSTELGRHMFDGCTNLTSVVMPNTLSGSCVGEYAFANCPKLQSITFPYRFEVIGKHMFDGCTSLNNVEIQSPPESDPHTYFTVIEDYAFNGCKNLTSLTIPANLSNISLFERNCLAGSGVERVFLDGMLSNQFNDFYQLSTQVVTTTQSLSSQKGTYPVGQLLDSSSYGVYEEALKTNIPLVIWCCGDGCGRCTAFKQNVASTAAWSDFVKSSPYYFVYFNFSSEYSRQLDNILWNKLKRVANSWQGNKSRDCLSYVAFFFVWKKLDGTLICECPRYLNGSAGNFDLIKNYCSQYFSGFQYDPSLMVATSTQTTTTTQTVVVSKESFNAWGVGHHCEFIMKDGIVFDYDPASGLTATYNAHYAALLRGNAIELTFEAGKTTAKYVVPNGIEYESVAPNPYYFGFGTTADPNTTTTKVKNKTTHVYKVFDSWSDTQAISKIASKITAKYTENAVRYVYYNNLGNLADVKDVKILKRKVDSNIREAIQFDLPSYNDIQSLSSEWKMNTCLSTAMTNTYTTYVDDGNDATETPDTPTFVAWLQLDPVFNGSSLAKVKIDTVLAGAKITTTAAKTSKIFIPWFSDYYSNGAVTENNGKWKINKKKLKKAIFIDLTTWSVGLFGKNGENKGNLLAYYNFHQFFPCKENGPKPEGIGKAQADVAVSALSTNAS